LLSLLYLLLASQGVTTASPPAVEQEIVIIAQRLRNWRARYAVRGSETTCATTRSTGDREIDAIGCISFETCVRQLRPRIDELIAELADRRFRARNGS